MSQLYVLGDDGRTVPVQHVHCNDEVRELQVPLEKNLELLPGDQIRPEDPLRWLLIKREMAVQDPGTGMARWSLDFLLVDHEGVPTLVECKRFDDARSPGEIVGQLLGYAANGLHYWTKDDLRMHAEDAARKRAAESRGDVDGALMEAVRSLRGETGESVEGFFDLIERNIRERRVRLVLFMDEAPLELRSMMEFLAGQMERSEALIVEAKQYDKDGIRLIVPSVFGYAERTRPVERPSGESRRRWNEKDFFEDAGKRLGEPELKAVRTLYEFSRTPGCEIRWGTGMQVGSFSIVASAFLQKSIIGVGSDGRMSFNFGSLRGSEALERFGDDLGGIVRQLGLPLADDFRGKYPGYRPGEWCGRVDDLMEELGKLLERYGGQPAGPAGGEAEVFGKVIAQVNPT